MLPILQYAGEMTVAYQLVICTPFLLLLGIPHGAIDNILYLRNNQIKNREFIGAYLVFVGMNVALWMLIPTVAYVLFLLISAYHFGQSQFSHYFKHQPPGIQVLYLLWGVAILSNLLFFNAAEIQQIISSNTEFAFFIPVQNESFLFYLSTVSTVLTLTFMVILTVYNALTVETLLMELLVFGLILASFFLMPLLVGFTLYFVILHSIKVLGEERRFLIAEKIVHSTGTFIKIVAPLTLLSIVGMGLLFAMIYFNWLNLTYGYCLLIVISSITLPHVFVMNKFYNILFNRNSV